jgi:hypothetical protein
MKKITFIILWIPLHIWGQDFRFSRENSHQILKSGTILRNAWVGGLNSPQFSSIDLNLDGTSDLFLYDKSNKKILTFIGNALTKEYQYASDYEALFPDFTDAGWVLLYDYNLDGKKDIFVGYNFGVQAYRNTSVSQLSFQKTYELLETESPTVPFKFNLPIFSTDIPAFYDVDGDNDLDVLFLDFHNGQMELHLNRSQERYGNSEYLEFEQVNYCWGDFLIQETNCDDVIFDIACPFNNMRFLGNDGRNKIHHTGSSVLVIDLNNDNLLDLFVSGISCNKTYVMLNQGTNKGAVFRNFNTQYPSNAPINLGVFTALYLEDINFDGKKDLIASSNLSENENNAADFAQSVWLYQNIGSGSSPVWDFVQKDFLQNTMLDVGQYAAPSFADIDADGDLDLFVGNGFSASNTNPPKASLKFYRNKGNAQQAIFELESEDFLSLSRYNFIDIKPQWADFNQDGSLDLGFRANEADNRRTTFYVFFNQAGRTQPMRFLANPIPLPIALEKGDKPCFYDLDKDGDRDILNLKPLGNIVFLENDRGNYIERNNNVLNIQISASGRNPSITIADFDQDGTDDLLLINDNGRLQMYQDIRANYAKNITPINEFIENPLKNSLMAPHFGSFSELTHVDLNGDRKPDFAIGLAGGGVQIFTNTHPRDALPLPTEKDLWLEPNPTRKYLYLHTNEAGYLEIYNNVGQNVFRTEIPLAQVYTLDVETWAAGMYITRFKSKSGETKVNKFVKLNY